MNLMKRRLRYSEKKFFDLYHLHYYFSKEPEIGGTRKMIIDFKNYEEDAVRDLIFEALEKLRALDIDHHVLVIRALMSHELIIGDMGSGSLDRLGTSLAGVFGCDYDPGVIYKRRHTVAIKSLNILQRQAALDGIYAFNRSGFESLKRILIIDDIVTTGTTARAIALPILQAFPNAEINVFAIAWTPTARQQEYLHKMEVKGNLLNEPEMQYGKSRSWIDTDFEFGDTHIAVE
jgi:predicted amidophosphoribosyltransferase